MAFANNTLQVEMKARLNARVPEREREREREKNYAMFSADIRALPDGGMLRSFREQLS